MIRLSPEAEADLRDIARRIKKDNGKAVALRIHNRILSSLRPLERYPLMGRAGRVPNTRELVMPPLPFIAIYRPLPGEIAVLRIIHGAMLWPPAKDEDG